MKLIDALEVLRQPVATDASQLNVHLACGFTPLHLQTFLEARLRSRYPKRLYTIETSIYGDLAGSIERLERSNVHVLTVLVEWEDLDSRLGMRSLGGWRPSNLNDIAESANKAAIRLRDALLRASGLVPTVICMPTLPMPPAFWTSPDHTCPSELRLHEIAAVLAASLSEEPAIHIANAQFLAEISPPSQRYDLRSDVLTGFPYSLTHASALAGMLANLIDCRPPQKGLITDLDDTLWAGILGEDGVTGISWDLERHTHLHGLYQQLIASLAGAGVLIGVASKNDSALVDKAFEGRDMLISKSDIFPFEVHWSPKSESVRRILHTWNVSPDSVVFIDDSPMEVDEVRASFPAMECILFPKDNYLGILNLFKHLRENFGKPLLTDDDSIRLESIRRSSEWRDSLDSRSTSKEDHLRTAEAFIAFTFTKIGGNARAFELVNKTNQFNLNGRRYSESDWRNFLSDPSAFGLCASYRDKFGPLGTIAVILGKTEGRKLSVQAWVMSCRAFSRRIEHQCLKHLFEHFDIDEIAFDYQTTQRNGSLQDFLTQLLGSPPAPGIRISREQFAHSLPELYHHVEGRSVPKTENGL